MYQVLLVTDQADVQGAFDSFEDWTTLGFAIPRVVTTAKEAVLLIESSQVDAVAYVLPKDEGQAFFAFLAKHPEVRCMEAATDALRLRRALSTLRRTLREQEGADVLTDVLPILQNEFYHSLLEGAPLKPDELAARTTALRMQIALDAPVCVAQLQLPRGEVYLEEVWRYGRDRLEVALRNFFERDLPDLRYVLGVKSPQEIKLLACPKADIDAERMREKVAERISSARAELREYLELEVKVSGLTLYPSLPALCARERGMAVVGV